MWHLSELKNTGFLNISYAACFTGIQVIFHASYWEQSYTIFSALQTTVNDMQLENECVCASTFVLSTRSVFINVNLLPLLMEMWWLDKMNKYLKTINFKESTRAWQEQRFVVQIQQSNLLSSGSQLKRTLDFYHWSCWRIAGYSRVGLVSGLCAISFKRSLRALNLCQSSNRTGIKRLLWQRWAQCLFQGRLWLSKSLAGLLAAWPA
jgi:hypothetical protein